MISIKKNVKDILIPSEEESIKMKTLRKVVWCWKAANGRHHYGVERGNDTDGMDTWHERDPDKEYRNMCYGSAFLDRCKKNAKRVSVIHDINVEHAINISEYLVDKNTAI